MSTFSLQGYADLVRAILERGYDVRGFADADPRARHLVLRHDVDMSLERAVEMGEAERALDVSATYFVLVTGEFYSILTATGRRALRRLTELGHHIGLHLDASMYATEALDEAARHEIAALEWATDSKVRIVSFHRPASDWLGNPAPIAGRTHAYQPRFFSEMGYCSDSRGRWQYGAPLAHRALDEGRAMQLLTHPIWWTGCANAAPAERLRRFLADRHQALDRELARQCDVHVPSLQIASNHRDP